MGLDKDTLHVVIRLPFKRPQGFVEPPSIVWTDEMEHKLWQYMSQKKTDWNYIAEQLGVPTSYVVRHAAFVYETQLRGIHQQLRLNGNNSSMSRNSTKSPTPSKSKPTSVRYSNTLQYQQQLQQQSIPEPQESSSQPKLQTNESSNTSSRISRENLRSTKSSTSTIYKSSGGLSTTTNSRTQTVTAYVNNNDNSSSEGIIEADDDEKKEKEQEEEEFSNEFERMRLQVEEPAFLPQRSTDHNILNSLSNSRQQLSMSIQNLKKMNSLSINSSASSSMHSKSTTAPSTQPQSPVTNTISYQPSTAPGSSNESAMNSMGSSFSDLSDTSVSQSALEEAFLSKFNQGGSKMSLLNFSKRYKE